MEQQLLEQQKSPNTFAFQLALAYSFYILVLTFATEKLGWSSDTENISVKIRILSTLLSYGPLILSICYIQVKHRSELGGFISYGRAFSCGFKLASYAGLFIAILLLLYYKVLSPNSLDEIIEMATTKAAQGGGDAELVLGMMQKYMIFFMMFGVAVGYTLVGAIVGLITAAIFKKDRPRHYDA